MPAETDTIIRFRKDLDPQDKIYTLEDTLCDEPVIIRATDRTTGIRFAIKQQVLDIQSEEQQKQVERELLSLEKIAHPRVIRMHKHVFVRGEKTVYQFMDLFRKTPLHTFVENLPQEANHFETYMELTAQLLDGITAVHSAGIVHRDLKPGNILIDQTKNGLDLRIIDFGLSVSAYTPYSRTYGTPGYMDPKTKTGATATARTDIFALGVILYDLFAGNLRRGRTFGTQMLSTKLAEAMRAKDEKQAELLCKIQPETLQDTPEKYRKNISEIINRCLYPVEIGRYFDANTATLDFHLLPLSEKKANILEKLKIKNGFDAINECAEAYNECVPGKFRAYSMKSVVLEEANVALMGVVNNLSIAALLPYIRMLVETGRLEAERKTLENYSLTQLDKIVASANVTNHSAESWLAALKRVTPDGKALWTRFTEHFHIPLDTLEKYLTETATYERHTSAEACTKRGLALLALELGPNAGTTYEFGRGLKQPKTCEDAETEFRKALKKNPAREDAKKGLIHALIAQGEHYHIIDRAKAHAKFNDALALNPDPKLRPSLYFKLECTLPDSKDVYAFLTKALEDREAYTDPEDLLKLKGRRLDAAFGIDHPDLTKLCEEYVVEQKAIQVKGGMALCDVLRAQRLGRAHYHLKHWKEAAQYASIPFAALSNDTASRDIVENSLRNMRLDELVTEINSKYTTEVRPLLDIPLQKVFIGIPDEESKATSMKVYRAFNDVCKGIPEEALQEFTEELIKYDLERGQYLQRYLYPAELPIELQRPRGMSTERALIYALITTTAISVLSLGATLARSAHIWPWNKPAAVQEK